MSGSFNPFDFPLLAAQQATGQYATCACLTFLLYDHLITLDNEIRHIWSAPWGFGKIAFLINRYLVPVEVTITAYMVTSFPPDEFCEFYAYWQFLSSVFSSAIVQAILLSRLYALYIGSRTLLYGLSTLWILCIGAMAGVAILVCVNYIVMPRPLSFVAGCNGFIPGYIFALFIPILVFDTVVFALTLARAIQQARMEFKSRLLETMTRDGLVYYAFSFAASLANVLIYQLAPLPLEAIGTPFLSCIIATMASRLMLNIRVVAKSSQNPTSAYDSEVIKTPVQLEFRVPSPVDSVLSGVHRNEEDDGVIMIGFYGERGMREEGDDGDDSSTGEWV